MTIVIVGLWIGLTEGGVIAPLYLPSPSEVGEAVSDIGPKLLLHVGSTTLVLSLSYTIGVTLGVGAGLLMSYWPILFVISEKTLESWRPVPPVALVPFFLLWFRFSATGRVVLVALGVAFIMVIATIEAIRGVNPTYVRASLSLGASRRRLFSTVIFPAVLPELRSGLRISLAIGMGLEIVAEFLGAQIGLGYLISVSRVTFATHTILLSIILLGVVTASLDVAVRYALRKAAPWWQGIDKTFG